MVVWGGFFFLMVVIFIQARIDAKLWGTIVTPGVALMGGYGVISGVYALASLFYDVVDINPLTYFFLACMSVATVQVSLITKVFVPTKIVELRYCNTSYNRVLRYSLIFVIFIYSSVAGFISIRNGGFWTTEANVAIGGGLIAHLHVLLGFVAIWYAIASPDRVMIKTLISLCSILSLSIYSVKGWIFIPFLAIVFSSILRDNSKPNYLKLVARLFLVGIGGIVIFFSIYLARVDRAEFDVDILIKTLGDIALHFLFYLTAGFIGLNEVINGLSLPGGLEIILAPFVNILNVVLGEKFVNIIGNIVVIGIEGDESGGNVFSYFGTLIGYLGFAGGIVIGLFVVGLCYLFFAISFSFDSFSLKAASLYMISVLSFGWFEYYFWNLNPLEMLFLGLMSFLVGHLFSGNKRITGVGA